MKSLKNALYILELFADLEDEMSLAELAELSGLNKATVHRIASTLVESGYLRQRHKRGKYSLGMKFYNFSLIAKRRGIIGDIATPYLSKLIRQLKESTLLVTWDKEKAVTTKVFPYSNHVLQALPEEGSILPLYCTSSGKNILANMTEEELQRYFSSGNEKLIRRTPNTITDINVIKKNLVTVKRKGIASDDEEVISGVRSVSAPLKNSEGNVVGDIGIIGPSVRLTRAKMRDSVSAIKSCALEISRELGYKGK